jgi:hypothetical protein
VLVLEQRHVRRAQRALHAARGAVRLPTSERVWEHHDR